MNEKKSYWDGAKVGDIVYSDGYKLMYIAYNEYVYTGPVVGVVSDVRGKNVRILAKDIYGSIAFDSSNTFYNSTTTTSNASAIADFDTIYNNNIIISQVGLLRLPGLQYCRNYKTSGTSAGEWNCPTMGDLMQAYNNKDVINAALYKVGGTQFSGHGLYSCTQYDASRMWAIDCNNGGYYGYNKQDGSSFRPILIINK